MSLSHFAREGTTEVDYVYLPELSHDDREIWQSPQTIRAEGPMGFRGLRFGRDIATIDETDEAVIGGQRNFAFPDVILPDGTEVVGEPVRPEDDER